MLFLMHAFRAYGGDGQHTCSWGPLSLASEQYMCFPAKGIHAPQDVGDGGGSHRPNGTSNSGDDNIWSASSDCFGEYCVYTNTKFFGNGISLVTTAPNHRRVSQIQVPELTLKSRHENIRTVEIPAKGRGLVATRTIRRGERIMAMGPALLVHRNAFRELEPDDLYYLMDMAVNSLPKSRKEGYLAQAGTMGGHKITDILFTNSFQIALGDPDGLHYGNFPEASLLNHDCRPNLAFFVDQNLTHHTHAMRDIGPGEELTISYLDALQLRSARQERTRNSLGFACGCSHCTMPREESDASDDRLRAISRIEESHWSWNIKPRR
ncbi:putative het domain protein [Rosellinia necatrix]|uniref:Putative het domain protein n=1 Tax=Rosellinia necatrix TaxID=77044 RepID=A0A1W2TB00_ROSNE|nr:putative het domain protein [Rosellinia necatrix]